MNFTEYPSKRNTINNVDIESLAIDENDPEKLYLEAEEAYITVLLGNYKKICPNLKEADIKALTGDISYIEAAAELGISYDAYRQRISRIKKKIRESVKI